MAETTFRANLNAAEIPFLTGLLGRTVIIAGLDQNSIKQAQFAGSGESLDQGIPQILYAENVVPTDFGLQSVGYSKVIDAATNTSGRAFDQLITLRDVNETTFLFSPAKGDCWIYDAAIGTWKSNFQLSPAFNGRFISKSSLNGRTFICFEKRGFFEYSAALQSLQAVTFTGLVPEEVIGICNSGNYNIAYTVDTVLWAALANETDFVASLSTGAGSVIPQDLKGPIVTVLPISGGMIIYTTRNIVVGLATNNARFPFNFKEVANGGGLETSEHASFENGLGTHYAWTSAGLQKITTSAAETVFPAATDFLAGRRIEDFDKTTLSFTETSLTADIKLKLTFLESRYLVISYGALLGSNLLSWSEQFNQTPPWTTAFCSVTPSSAILDPFETDGASRVVYSGAGVIAGVGDNLQIQQSVNNIEVVGFTYSFSVYLRTDTPKTVRLLMQADVSAENILQDVQITTTWTRVSVSGTFVTPGGIGILCDIILRDAAAGVGEVFQIFGAQLEKATTSTKYVKTTLGPKPTGDSGVFDYCLIFDTVLKRWGKLKFTHVDCFDYTYPSSTGELAYKDWEGSYLGSSGISYSQLSSPGSITPIPKKSIGFLKDTGAIYLLNFEFNATTNAVLLLGKYQLTRTSVATMQKIEVENPEVKEAYAWDSANPITTETDRNTALAANSPYFDLRVLPSQDGRNFQTAIRPTLVYAASNILCYGLRNSALSHTLYFSGAFHVRSVLMTLTKNGRPRIPSGTIAYAG